MNGKNIFSVPEYDEFSSKAIMEDVELITDFSNYHTWASFDNGEIMDLTITATINGEFSVLFGTFEDLASQGIEYEPYFIPNFCNPTMLNQRYMDQLIRETALRFAPILSS